MTSSVPDRQLVYLVYGRVPAYRYEAKYSLLSALRETPAAAMPRVRLYTDEPEAYAGWPVDTIRLDDATLRDWSGRDGYLHRRKAAAILHALPEADTSLFIDTDTFFRASVERLFARLDSSAWLVDEVEGRWGDWADQPLYAATADYLRARRGIADDLLLINSGVLGLRRADVPLMREALALIDELHPRAPSVHVVEQFAVAVAAYGRARPAEARGIVRHYYSEKPYWRQMLGHFFQTHGEAFSTRLVEASAEVPRHKPKPPWPARLSFRLRSLGLGARERKLARLAFYATSLPGERYAHACAVAYVQHLLDLLAPVAEPGNAQRPPARWLAPLSARQRAEWLEIARRIEPGGRIDPNLF